MINSNFKSLWKKVSIQHNFIRFLIILSFIFFGFALSFANSVIAYLFLISGICILIISFILNKKKVIFLSELMIKYPREYEKRIFSDKNTDNHNLFVKSSIEFYKGNIPECFELCLKIVNDKNINSFPEYKYNTFTLLASCYFFAENFERLSEIISVMSSKTNDSKKVLKLKAQFNQVSLFYSNYIDGDFENCKSVCKTVLSEIKEKNNPRKILYTYLLAVSHYKLKEYDSSKELFEKVVEQFPDTIYAQQAQKYIDAMANDSEYQPITLQNVDISTLESNAITNLLKKQKKITRKTACFILAVLISSVFVGNILNNLFNGKDFFGYYYNIEDFRASPQYLEYYENGNVIANVKSEKYCFDFIVNENKSFTIIRIKYKNERFKHSSICPSETIGNIYSVITDPISWSIKGYSYNNVIGFDPEISYLILPSEIEIPEDSSETYTFMLDGEAYILCIKHTINNPN